ncbi:MAG: hypothetical protein V9F82_04385 [Dermatophilaceae bacterium]
MPDSGCCARRCPGPTSSGPAELPSIHHRKEYDATKALDPDYRITCVFVDKRHRRRGASELAITGALDLIAWAGGGRVESYPHDLTHQTKKMSSTYSYKCMCMSVLERRLQLLIDAARYSRVAAEAERSGRSVAAVIREAIDLRFPDDGDAGRASAASALLSVTEQPAGRVEGPAELKAAYAAELAAKVGPE